jgi:hypothetical protein
VYSGPRGSLQRSDCRCERNCRVGCAGLVQAVSGSCALFDLLRDLPRSHLLRRAIFSRYPGAWSAWLRGGRARCTLAAGNSDVGSLGIFRCGRLLTLCRRIAPRSRRASQLVPSSASEYCGYRRSLCASAAIGTAHWRRPFFAMLNAAVEEAAYRGVFLHALDRSLGPGFAALLLQALAFGAIHIRGFPRGWPGVGLACIFGLLMGVIRRRAGGMFAPWIAHVFTDVVIAGIVLLLGRPEGPNHAMQRTASQPAIYLSSVRHPHFGCVESCSGLAVADLVSR